jgi:hypothetical protein
MAFGKQRVCVPYTIIIQLDGGAQGLAFAFYLSHCSLFLSCPEYTQLSLKTRETLIIDMNVKNSPLFIPRHDNLQTRNGRRPAADNGESVI